MLANDGEWWCLCNEQWEYKFDVKLKARAKLQMSNEYLWRCRQYQNPVSTVVVGCQVDFMVFVTFFAKQLDSIFFHPNGGNLEIFLPILCWSCSQWIPMVVIQAANPN